MGQSRGHLPPIAVAAAEAKAAAPHALRAVAMAAAYARELHPAVAAAWAVAMAAPQSGAGQMPADSVLY